MTRTPARTVSPQTAGAVLEAVRGMFPAGIDFTLYSARHEGMAGGCWSITAEGAQVEPDWVRKVAKAWSYERWLLREMGGVRMCPPTFPAVLLEPMTSGSLGIYPPPAEAGQTDTVRLN